MSKLRPHETTSQGRKEPVRQPAVFVQGLPKGLHAKASPYWISGMGEEKGGSLV